MSTETAKPANKDTGLLNSLIDKLHLSPASERDFEDKDAITQALEDVFQRQTSGSHAVAFLGWYMKWGVERMAVALSEGKIRMSEVLASALVLENIYNLIYEQSVKYIQEVKPLRYLPMYLGRGDASWGRLSNNMYATVEEAENFISANGYNTHGKKSPTSDYMAFMVYDCVTSTPVKPVPFQQASKK